MSPRSMIDTLARDPDNLYNDDFLEMNLSVLSKNLPTNLGQTKTFSIYIRWLEANRKVPSNATKLWPNTTMQWGMALRARGFTKTDLVNRVKEWKEDYEARNGPFRSFERRYPPMPADIKRAFDHENPNNHKVPESSHTMEMNFAYPPPAGYVCNRCGLKGHHLQACPTNMDPSYDKPPTSDYFCQICRSYGLHFKSLCPKNTDPMCIFQKRKVAGIAQGNGYDDDYDQAPAPKRAKKGKTGGILENWERDRDIKPSRRFISENSPNSNPSSPVMSGLVTNPDEIEDLDPEETPAPAEKSASVNHPFTQRLISKYASMSEIVNPRKPRPTALEMWEEDDNAPARVQMMYDLTSSPPKTPEYGSSGTQDSSRLTPFEEPRYLADDRYDDEPYDTVRYDDEDMDDLLQQEGVPLGSRENFDDDFSERSVGDRPSRSSSQTP